MAIDTIHDGTAAVEDELLAATSSLRVLISMANPEGIQIVARRIHKSSGRADRPFVALDASDLPADRRALRDECSGLFAAARGGSVLLNDVERMPRNAQDTILTFVEELEAASPLSAFRLLSGTTVALFERVAAGTFSEELFYRLNVIHLRGSR